MSNGCSVRGCDSHPSKDSGIKFFAFPKIWRAHPRLQKLSAQRYRRWMLAINQTELNTSLARVCSKHFVSGKPSLPEDCDDPDWVPSLRMEPLKTNKPTENLPNTVETDADASVEEALGIIEDMFDCRQDLQQVFSFLEENQKIEPMEEDPCASEREKLVEEFLDENMDIPEPAVKQPQGRAIRCCVPNCSNVRIANKSSVKFFRFPNATKNNYGNPYKRNRVTAWIDAIKRTDITTANHVHKIICTQHFQTGAPANDEAHPDWVPNQKMPKEFYSKTTGLISSIDIALPEDEIPIENEESKKLKVAYQKIESLEKQVQLLNTENKALNQQLMAKDLIISTQNEELRIQTASQKLINQEKDKEIDSIKSTLSRISLNRESFKDDDRKINYFTGLQSLQALDMVFDCVKNNLVCSSKKGVNKFDALIMVLMKLRLDLPMAYLAYRFGISSPTATSFLHTNLRVLNDKMSDFIKWPKKEEHQEKTYVYYKRVLGNKFTCLLEFIDDPGPQMSKEAQRTYVKMKHLIAISQAGAIIFVSKGYESDWSVKQIAESCGLLNHADDGDVILSHYGTQAHEVSSENGSKVLLTLTRQSDSDVLDTDLGSSSNDDGQQQGEKMQMHRTLVLLKNKYFALVNKHNHGVLRSYMNKIENNYFYFALRVCCALTNLSPGTATVDDKTC